MSGDGRNLGAELLLDLVQVETILPVDQVDGETEMTKPTRTTNSVKIRLGILGEVKVDDYIDSLNIDTPGQEIRTYKIPTMTGPEIVEDTIAGVLQHASVRIKARVAELGDFLSQELHTGGGVTEDDRLVDLEAGEEGIQAMDLLLLLDEGIILCDTAESELVHEVDFVGIVHVFILEFLDYDRESRTK